MTFFDHGFLLQGLALHSSLRRWCPQAQLWVVCLDAASREAIDQLRLDGLYALALEELETPELLAAKQNRTWTEYIYTITPFTFEFLHRVQPAARRITYLDADLFFFDSPARLFEELTASGKQVLMTEHGFAPEYRSLEATSGRFCVQFLPVVWDENGRRVVRDWQRQCLESTGISGSARNEVFGDQKYLEAWPDRFPGVVHVSTRRSDMLGPWNADHARRTSGAGRPVFYHFHSFRFLPGRWVQLCAGYRIDAAMPLYDEYVAALSDLRRTLLASGRRLPVSHAPRQSYWKLRLMWRAARGRATLRRWT